MVPGGGHRGVGEDQRRGTPPRQAGAPRPKAFPPQTPPPFGERVDARPPGRGEGGSHEHAEARDPGTPLTRRPLNTNR